MDKPWRTAGKPTWWVPDCFLIFETLLPDNWGKYRSVKQDGYWVPEEAIPEELLGRLKEAAK